MYSDGPLVDSSNHIYPWTRGNGGRSSLSLRDDGLSCRLALLIPPTNPFPTLPLPETPQETPHRLFSYPHRMHHCPGLGYPARLSLFLSRLEPYCSGLSRLSVFFQPLSASRERVRDLL